MKTPPTPRHLPAITGTERLEWGDVAVVNGLRYRVGGVQRYACGAIRSAALAPLYPRGVARVLYGTAGGDDLWIVSVARGRHADVDTLEIEAQS